MAAEETNALSWRIAERSGGTTVELSGEIDENSDFGELRRRLKGAVTFDLGAVRRINSFGVREWIDFVRQLPAVTEMVLIRCSPAFVVQMNMITNFRGPARVRSILAPYLCEKCHAESEELLEVEPLSRPVKPPPRRPCPRCGALMLLDEQPERYLAFLYDP